MNNKAVWVTRVWRDTVWAMLHNIKIRQSDTVLAPRVTPFGSGSAAGISIDLPPAGAATVEAKPAYSGYFKVICEEKSEAGKIIRVVDGSNPGGAICGYSDLAPEGIPVAAFAWRPYYVRFFLVATYLEFGKYRCEVTDALPSGNNFALIQLGHIDAAGKVTQDWTGGVVYFWQGYTL